MASCVIYPYIENYTVPSGCGQVVVAMVKWLWLWSSGCACGQVVVVVVKWLWSIETQCHYEPQFSPHVSDNVKCRSTHVIFVAYQEQALKHICGCTGVHGYFNV